MCSLETYDVKTFEFLMLACFSGIRFFRQNEAHLHISILRLRDSKLAN